MRTLTSAFLDAHRERILADLSERLNRDGSAGLLPVHCALFDVVRAEVRDPSPRRTVAGVSRVLADAGRWRDAGPLVPGQVALWVLTHRMLCEVDGPHRGPDVVHEALTMAGDAGDGVLGALIDAASAGDTSVDFPGWGTRVAIGRTCREFHLFSRITRDLLDARGPAGMLKVLRRGILNTFHLRSLSVATVNHEEGLVEPVYAYPAPPITQDFVGRPLPLSHPDILCEVARTGRMEVIGGWDPRYHEQIVQADGSVVFRQCPADYNAGQTAFFVPILARGRTVGIVATGSTQDHKQVVLREIERMRPFLDQVGVVLLSAIEVDRRRQVGEMLREALYKLERQTVERVAELSNAISLLKREIVDRERAEEALDMQRVLSARADHLRSLGEMAAGIAHELNQPLTGIRGLSEHLLIGIDRGWRLTEERTRENLRLIVEQVDRMSHIIEHVRVFSREAGRPELRPVQVNEVVGSAVGMLSVQLRNRGVALTCELTEGLPLISANPFSLEEVVLNLLSNARDAVEERGRVGEVRSGRCSAPTGRRSVPLTAKGAKDTKEDRNGVGEWEKRVWVRTRRDEGRVVVEVEDNGVGIPGELLGKVFDPFFTTKGPSRGTGLGLSVSRSIVEEFGGVIQIQSSPGQGTTATVSLPVKRET